MNRVRALLMRAGRLWRPRKAVEVTATELERWLAMGQVLQLLDIRDAAAFQERHLPGALHLPRDQWERELAALDRGLATVVY